MLCSCAKKQQDAEQTSESESETESKAPWQNRIYGRDFVAFDADGDGNEDHFVQNNLVAMSGGHGGYEMYLYGPSDSWGYDEIFNSNDYLDEHNNIDIQVKAIEKLMPFEKMDRL